MLGHSYLRFFEKEKGIDYLNQACDEGDENAINVLTSLVNFIRENRDPEAEDDGTGIIVNISSKIRID